MVSAVLEHNFTGTSFTLGIEEELMICDAESLELSQSIDVILGDLPDDLPGEVKPELMQSVLEVATLPCANITEAADQLRALRRCVREVAARNGLAIGAAGTHPSALYEDQLIVDHPRYKQLAGELLVRERMPFLNAEIVGVQVQVQIRRVPDRRNVAGAVPSGPYTEGLTQDSQLFGRRDAPDRADMDADKIDQPIRDKRQPFLRMDKQLAHCDRGDR